MKICGSLAVAAVEDIIGTDQSEVWTALRQEEPESHEYEANEYTDIIEKSTNLVSSEFLNTLSSDIAQNLAKREEQDGLDSFWMCFLEKDQIDDLDQFTDLLKEVLEEIG